MDIAVSKLNIVVKITPKSVTTQLPIADLTSFPQKTLLDSEDSNSNSASDRAKSTNGSAAVGLILLVFALLGVTGCGTSTTQFVEIPTSAAPSSTSSRIYVMRPASSTARTVQMFVKNDRRVIGATGPGGYLYWDTAPGDQQVTSITEAPNRINIQCRAGETYYIKQHLAFGGIYSGSKLELLSAEEGRKTLRKCNPPTFDQASMRFYYGLNRLRPGMTYSEVLDVTGLGGAGIELVGATFSSRGPQPSFYEVRFCGVTADIRSYGHLVIRDGILTTFKY